ncbi:MAG: guanylate cyclase [Desulfobacteraceae bacterium]|nr:MAG: guanylate cyclase [Desulfobacteraceae bacterium]
MICPECRNEIPEGSKFCKECGRKLDLICPECGRNVPLDSKFCIDCGHDLCRPVSPKDVPKIDYQHPQSYTPKHLAEKILTTRSAIEGERKIVTVMFADVAEFTSLSEKLDPEDVHGIMDGCFKILMDEIHRYEGTINQFTGDGVMALFGAPLAHEDHAQRACHAALAIQKAMQEYGERVHRIHGIDFKMRIGLNSGPVVVGSIGDDLRMDYTAQGDTSNLAARMENIACPGGIWVTRHIYRQTKEFFEFESLGEIQVKGKEKPIEAYQLLRPTQVRTRIAASTAKGLTRFMGRGREMETLKEAFEKVRSAEGQVVGIVGEAGVGKSRLLLEFLNLLPKDGYGYFEGRCLHYGGAMPYLPILDVLRSFLDVKEGEQEQTVRQKLKERILGLDKNLRHIISPIQELLSIKVDDEVYARLEPKQKREKTFEAIRDLLVRGSQDRPLVLTIEDLHWIDKTTEEFLSYMIGWLPRTRILLLLLHRPEYTHPWGSKSYYSRIGVEQLSTITSADLIRAILDGDVVPELRDLILTRAAGNPLFMEELTYNLLDNGSIRKKDDHFILAQDACGLQVPDTIQGIIAARMDRLEESLKRIMQVAAVVGREFAFRILETILEMKEGLKSGLVNLQGLEFIYEKSLFPELEYIFRHALVQEVAYNSLLINRRKEIHEKIGQAIENLHRQRLEEFYEMLAYHYSKSGNLPKAYEFLKQAARKAVQKDALLEGLRFYNEAMGVLLKLSPTDENKREQIKLIVSMCISEVKTGFSVDFFPLLQKAEVLAEDLKDEMSRLTIRSYLGFFYLFKGGNSKLGWEYLESCIEHPELIHDIGFTISNGFDLCTSALVLGDFQSINRIAPTVIGLIETRQTQAEFYEKPFNPYSYILSVWGHATGMSGNFDNGERLLVKGLLFAEKINHRATLGQVRLMYGGSLALKGDGHSAITIIKKAIKDLEESQTMITIGIAWTWLGYAHYLMGDYQIALEFTEKGLKIQTDLGLPYLRSFCHYCCSLVHFCMDNLENAKNQAEQALQYSLANNEKFIPDISKILLWRVLAKIDPEQIKVAEKQILQGISSLEELGMLPSSGISYLWLGEIFAESGRKEAALINLRKAETLFREMGMDYWLGKAQEALAKLL